jgi:DNA-binding HxlR family transcriptional regulator
LIGLSSWTPACVRPSGILDENVMMPTKTDPACSIARSLNVLGERWTFLILREAAFAGTTRFNEFRTRLGAPSDVLSERLATLVAYGVMEKVPYHEPGSRVRDAYLLTEAGRELTITLGALLEWGDRNLPLASGPTKHLRVGDSARPVHVAFVDDRGREVPFSAVSMVSANVDGASNAAD